MVLKWIQQVIERAAERSAERRDERDKQDRETYGFSFRGNGRVATTVEKIIRSPKFHEDLRQIQLLRESGFL